MHPGILLAFSRPAVAAALVAYSIWRAMANLSLERQVAAIAKRAGYAPFGATEGPLLSFRSSTSYLRIARGEDPSYIQALLAARPADPRADVEWMDDDLLRQVLFEEVPDAAGQVRVWHSRRAFARFLRERLPHMTAAVASNDPGFRGAIDRARAERRARRLHVEATLAEALVRPNPTRRCSPDATPR